MGPGSLSRQAMRRHCVKPLNINQGIEVPLEALEHQHRLPVLPAAIKRRAGWVHELTTYSTAYSGLSA
ncbi:hypothetical protein MCOR09_006387 [Pyricularia oryzae]|nr:hypothetical protein MCOR09_006387 [Pyricularia oryzae]